MKYDRKWFESVFQCQLYLMDKPIITVYKMLEYFYHSKLWFVERLRDNGRNRLLQNTSSDNFFDIAYTKFGQQLNDKENVYYSFAEELRKKGLQQV